MNKWTFPDHNIDPKKKDAAWHLQYCKAAWAQYGSSGFESLYKKRLDYKLYKDYSLGKQTVDKYKPLVMAGDSKDNSYLKIDWAPLPLFTKFRELALAIINKIEYNVISTPIDALAQQQIDEYFKEQKSKIKMREQLGKIDPNVVAMSPLAKQEGEPEDLEELEIHKMFTYKHQMSAEMEQALEYVLAYNDFEEERKRMIQNVFDYGVGGYKEYVDSNGAVKIRAVSPNNLITSYSNRRDFKDVEYVGEVIQLSISDIRQLAGDQLSEEQYEHIANLYKGRLGNDFNFPIGNVYNRPYNDYKVQVLDLEFYSYNPIVFEDKEDKRGNRHLTKTNPAKDGDNYRRTNVKVVYKCKWVVDTDYIFDFGLATNMKRQRSRLADTTLSFHLFSPRFDEMNMSMVGWVVNCIPVIDSLHISWYKYQQAIAQSVPRGFAFDLDALEDIPLGKGGKQLTPYEVMSLFLETGHYPFRKRNEEGQYTNYQPIFPTGGGMSDEAQRWFSDIYNKVQLLRDMLGLNELTDASTPDPRTLTTTAKLAAQSTNNALYGIFEADRHLFESLCEGVFLRMQTIARKNTNLYEIGLGKNSLRFLKVSPDVSNHEFGIKIEMKPDDEEKLKFLQRMEIYAQQGMLEPEDQILIEGTDNLKMAQHLLAYKVKKRKKEAIEMAQQQQQQNAEVQMQAAQAAEQAKQQTLQLEYQLKMQLEQMKMQFQMEIEQLKAQVLMQTAQMKSSSDIQNAMIDAEARAYSTDVLAYTKEDRSIGQKQSDKTK